MAEIVGAVASAAQLAATSLNLLDLLKKIKGGSSTLKKYQQQLHELQNLSESISHNPLLQTADVDYHTRSILFSISQNNLEQRLQKGRFLRTCIFFYIERDLLELFTALDRQKSSLSLAIEHIQSRAIHQIQSDIRAMADRTNLPPTANKTPSSSSNELTRRGDNRPLTLRNFSQSSHHTSPNQPLAQAAMDFYHSSTSSGANIEPETINSMFSRYPFQGNFQGNQYNNNYAGQGQGQHNGPIIDGSLCSPDGCVINDIPDEYSGNETAGGTYQFQGATFIYPADHGPVTHFPIYRGNWDNNSVGDSDATPFQSGQINGNRYVREVEGFNFWGVPQGRMAQKKEK